MPKYKRSANGSGTVTKMSGNRRKPWRAMSPAYEDENGDFIRKTIGYYETRQEALDALVMFRFNPDNFSSITLSELYDIWKAEGYKNLSKNTITVYKGAYKHMSSLYNKKVVDIRTPQLQACINEAINEGLSRSICVSIKTLEHQLEKYAMQNDIIQKNYAEFVKIPRKENNEKRIFTSFEIKKIEDGAEKGIGISDSILLMIYTGWRIQEFCSITVFDWDPENCTLRGGVKTNAGKNRIVPVPQKLVQYVESAFENNGGKLSPYNGQALRKHFYETLDILGIKNENKEITPHTTRHTYNSMLYQNGVSAETRMKLMGHSDETTNRNVYTHADIETLQKAVEKIS